MKKIQFIILAFLAISPVFAQQNLIALQSVKETPEERKPSKPESNHEQFVFKVYNTSDMPKGEIDPHFLGDEIASKWTVVNELYLRKGEVSVGFSTSYTETVKPSVFNAVYRLNNHFKRAVNKGLIQREEAQKQFSWILDCAVAIFHCDETGKFETALMKVKDPEQIIQLFNSVRIEKI
ncbi:MAG: hypothetical protein WC384_21340 [Prolixibacteraceae bacterium]